jgi:hypothetical protein
MPAWSRPECPSCGSALGLRGDRFCGACGATLTQGPAKSPGAREPVPARRRALSVGAAVLLFGALASVVYLSLAPTSSRPSGPRPALTTYSRAVEPGFSSPAAASAGFVGWLENGDTKAACGYVVRSLLAMCLTTLSPTYRAVGPIRIGEVATAGPEAVVSIVGEICVSGNSSSCVANRDPGSGLAGLNAPGSLAHLISAILGEANDSSCQASSLRCEFAPPYGFDLISYRYGRRWYVDLA